jgi:hypothetical protein
VTTAGEVARTVAAARDLLDRIQNERDRVGAIRAALRLAEGLREVSDEAAELRARLIVAIVDSGEMTRRALALELGISEQRVGQLYQAGQGLG